MTMLTAPADSGEAAASRRRRPAMTWLVWRQHRGEALAAVLVIALLAVVVTPNALHLYDVTAQLTANGCLGSSPGLACASLTDAFNATSRTLSGLVPWLNLLPALAGAFIGAPLVAREIEDGTWRLAWSQGITRLSWLRGQLLGTLAVTAGSAALLTAVTTWWLSPVNEVGGRFTNNGFDFAGIIPLAWSLLAFAAGVLAGTLVKRVIPAMAVTLFAYLAIRLPAEYLLRPHYLPALQRWGVPFALSGLLARNDWEIGVDPVAPGGHSIMTASQFDQVQHTAELAMGRATSPSDLTAELNHWLTVHGYTQVITYQPASRFWAFQGIEAAACLVLAIALLTLATRLVPRRLP
jgi:hypothetical protein